MCLIDEFKREILILDLITLAALNIGEHIKSDSLSLFSLFSLYCERHEAFHRTISP